MKKCSFRFPLRILRKWTIPAVTAVLFLLLLLAWQGLEHSVKIHQDRAFYKAYEMLDRCLTAYYNNDAETLLAQFPDYVIGWSIKNTRLEEDALRAHIKKMMNEQYEERQRSGATYTWEYIGWDKDVSDKDYSILQLIGMQNFVAHQRIYRAIEIRVTKTVGDVSTETTERYLMVEKDNVWYTDLVNNFWLGQSLFPENGMAAYDALSVWIDAWCNGRPFDLLEAIPSEVLDSKLGTGRKVWEKAMLKYVAAKAADDREKGITYQWYMDTQTPLAEDKLQALQQEYQDTCGLNVAAAQEIGYTFWKTIPQSYGAPVATIDSRVCTVVQIDGKWYVDTLHLPEGLRELWNITANTQ